jgi:NAD(P)H dehydrogenase (quinone)
MKILVILGHPDKNSFNHAVAAAAVQTLEKNGHAVMFHDLYEEIFDPVLPLNEVANETILSTHVELHCREAASADGIIVIHPNWWGQPPAIVKGWIDRVLRSGVAYRFLEGDAGEGVPVGLLKAQCAVVFNTSNTPEKREREAFGDPLEALWKNCIFGLCGVKKFYRKMFCVIVDSTMEQRQKWLGKVKEIIDRYFPADSDRAFEG